MNARFRKSKCSRRHGLTLVELLVVLVILAIMTVIAVQSLDYLADQARFEATQRTLGNVQSAVLGTPNQTQPDGTPMLSGFVADLGRPPIADTNLQISELWAQGTLPSYQAVVVPAASDPINSDVVILAGWRGPYLRLPPTSQQGFSLYDGYGNAFSLLKFGPAKVDTVGDVVLSMQYSGIVSDAYTDVLANKQVSTSLTNNPTNLSTVITGTVIDTDTTTAGAANVKVRLFYVDFSNPALFNAATNTWTLASKVPVEDTGTGIPPPYTFTFKDLSAPTLLNAKVNGSPMPATGNMVLRAYQDGLNKSPILRLRIPAGGMIQDIRFDLK